VARAHNRTGGESVELVSFLQGSNEVIHPASDRSSSAGWVEIVEMEDRGHRGRIVLDGGVVDQDSRIVYQNEGVDVMEKGSALPDSALDHGFFVGLFLAQLSFSIHPFFLHQT